MGRRLAEQHQAGSIVPAEGCQGSQPLTIWPAPQAELLHPNIHQHCFRVPRRWTGGRGPCGAHPALSTLGEAVCDWAGRSGG